MSGALLQLVARGHEDTHLMVDDNDTEEEHVNFFRQLYKKHTSFSVQTIELDAPIPDKVFGETMRFTLPRKGDLLGGLTLAITMKRKASQPTFFPAEELIEEANLIAGLQTIDHVTNEWMRMRRELFDTADTKAAYRRMVDFTEDDHLTKTLWLPLPFFIQVTPFPLIAAQLHNLELSLAFKEAVRGIDPNVQPQIRVYADYIYLDNSERVFFSKQSHSLLIEQLHVQDEPVSLQQAEYASSYEKFSIFPAVYKSVLGNGIAADVVLADRLLLAHPPEWTGLTSVLYDMKADAGTIKVRARFQVPATGSFGISWMDLAPGSGYSVKFETIGNDVNIYVYRSRTVIAIFRKNSAWSDARTSIQGPGVPLSLQTAWSYGEAWIVVNLEHDIQRRLDGIRLSISIEGFGVGEYWASIPAKYTQAHAMSVVEGTEPIDTRDLITTFSIYGDSTTTDVIATDIGGSITTIRNLAIADNFTSVKSQLYFRHPVKYLAWATSPSTEFGKYATGTLGNDGDAHDPLHSASLTFNAHERFSMMPSLYYNAVQPLQYTKTSPATGIHFLSFCLDPSARAYPSGSANFSRMASVVLSQRYKRANMSIVETTTRLSSNDEMLAEGASFDRLRVYAMCWNILRIEGGLCGMAYSS